MKYMMVLNDLETFTDLEGCVIVEVPDDFDEDTVTDSEKESLLLEEGNTYTWDDTLHDDCKVVKIFSGNPAVELFS